MIAMALLSEYSDLLDKVVAGVITEDEVEAWLLSQANGAEIVLKSASRRLGSPKSQPVKQNKVTRKQGC